MATKRQTKSLSFLYNAFMQKDCYEEIVYCFNRFYEQNSFMRKHRFLYQVILTGLNALSKEDLLQYQKEFEAKKSQEKEEKK